MAKEPEEQLSFDWSQTFTNVTVEVRHSDSLPSAEVFCLHSHRQTLDEAERSHHFSEILKLVSHLNT
jgi:hypothetical protein